MKHSTFCIVPAIMAVFLLISACNETGTPAPTSDVPVAASAEAKARSYSLQKLGSVVFIFDEATQQDALQGAGVSSIDGLDLRGSFNGWKNTGLELTRSVTDPGIWYLEQPLEIVNVPGNSGQPEFKFVAHGTVNGIPDSTAWLDVPAAAPPAYDFGGNHIVVFAGDDLNVLLANKQQAQVIKTLSDFDLGTDTGREDLSNFRIVPGTSGLYRAYHPFKKSRPALDTEEPRITLVNQFMQEKNIKSVITLSTQESADTDIGESVQPYMRNLMDNGHDLYLDVSYNLVYFNSDTAAFGQLIQQVVAFIIDEQHEAPVMIHCRLGTDRTGVVAATLAALVGSSWNDIATDYQRSNHMGIQEFRDFKLMQYSFEHMLDLPRGTLGSVDLRQEMRAYFIDHGYLTQQQIDALVLKIG